MLNLNDMLYYTKIRDSWITRKRVDYIDEQGVRWYRYDKSSWSYAIKPYRIVGCSIVTTSWVDTPLEVDLLESCYYLENGEQVLESDIDNNYSWYTAITLAEARIAAHKESVNEL